jgi:hypothetical protein
MSGCAIAAFKLAAQLFVAWMGGDVGADDMWDDAGASPDVPPDVADTSDSTPQPQFGGGRFDADYVGPDGTPLVTTAANTMYDPVTKEVFTPYSSGVSKK